ncbi:MAG: hypothetical protein ACOYEB_01135 [Enterococcus lemanii]|jgi:hypothetical protein
MMSEAMQALLTTPEQRLQLTQLQEDLYFAKIPKEDYSTILEETNTFAKNKAKECRIKYSGQSLKEILKALNLQLVYEELPISEEFTSIGYFETPAKIGINQALKQNDTILNQFGLEWLTFDVWEEIVIAHELFHYFQSQEKENFLNKYKVSLWKLGFYTHQTKINTLSEIAAMVFAKEFLQLDFYPGYLHLFLIYPNFPKEVNERMQEVIVRANHWL